MIVSQCALLIGIGFAGGIAVGSGFVAFITVLDIVPRLAQLSKTPDRIHAYESAIVAGAVTATWLDLRGWSFDGPIWLTAVVGLLAGCFVGLLAAALTEVINVLPILAKRLAMQDALLYLLMAMAMGKVAGSLFQWLMFHL
ncbi:stage V sporulation protein AB [Polycladomyces sp. WAk]|uniref:Stage V sporulation protein AB n=1 Tax=Polycladomyces zharkentensis TaxID=2807616 RepID=A0ABS2WKE7_9BACL|nr:stage V sporulation protein AB [Polycladomyces sp. WAk]MBN2909765.1 stage V sporulation protein AB [Polycladomyces sp. WAk]